MKRWPLPEPGGVRSGPRSVASGFTLLEMMLVVTIIAIIAGTLIPIIGKPQKVEKHFETVKEMAGIVDAVMGRPDLGLTGFVEVMGRLPNASANSPNMAVDELYTPPTNPYLLRTPGWGGTTGGWNGPFLRTYQLDPWLDEWGSLYQFTLNPLNPGDWRITSPGPDMQLGTADDIVLPDANGFFSTMANVTIELYTQLQGSVTRLPDSALVTTSDATETTVTQAAVPIIWLPSTIDGTLQQCTGVPGAVTPASCPGACYVVDAAGTAVPAAGSSGLMPPYGITCSGATTGRVGIPFGLHHVQLAAAPIATGIQDATLNLGQVDFNVLVAQGYSSARIPLWSTGIPGGTTPSSAQWIPVVASSAANSQIQTILRGTGRTSPTTTATILDLRFQGTLSVTPGVQCALKLNALNATTPPVTGVPVVVLNGATAPTWTFPASPLAALGNVPFNIDVLAQVPASATGYDLSQVTLTMNLNQAAGGTCSVAPASPVSGSGAVPNVSGMLVRMYEP